MRDSRDGDHTSYISSVTTLNVFRPPSCVFGNAARPRANPSVNLPLGEPAFLTAHARAAMRMGSCTRPVDRPRAEGLVTWARPTGWMSARGRAHSCGGMCDVRKASPPRGSLTKGRALGRAENTGRRSKNSKWS